jgi:hypothetical protein
MKTIDNTLNIGSSVLYRLKKGTFDKEDVRWSKAVYEIVEMDSYIATYHFSILSEPCIHKVQIRSKNGKLLYKNPNDLRIVNASSTEDTVKQGDLFDIEKILEHKKMKMVDTNIVSSGLILIKRLGSLKTI